MSNNPFDLSQEERVSILLARVLYLKTCIFKGEKPNPHPLYTGPNVVMQNARTAVDLLGFDEEQTESDLIKCGDLLFEQATRPFAAEAVTA